MLEEKRRETGKKLINTKKKDWKERKVLREIKGTG